MTVVIKIPLHRGQPSFNRAAAAVLICDPLVRTPALLTRCRWGMERGAAAVYSLSYRTNFTNCSTSGKAKPAMFTGLSAPGREQQV